MAFLDEIDDLHEGQKLELKRADFSVPRDVWESYSAFANTEGGEIVLGVEEIVEDGVKRFAISGVTDPNAIMKGFWDQVRNPELVSKDILPGDAVHITEVQGEQVIVISVPKADRYAKPVMAYDRKRRKMIAYVRRGESDSVATSDEMARMLHDKSDGADAGPLEELGTDVFDPRTVNSYRQRFAGERPTSPWVAEGDEDFLFHVNALGPDDRGEMHPTRAGLLAFGQEHWIRTIFPSFFLDFQSKLDPGLRWTDRLHSGSGDWSGNLIDFYYEVAQRLDRALAQPFGLVDDGKAHSTRTVVNDAVHEAIANALVHAYYGLGSDSQVRVILEPERLVVSNSGTFLVDREVAIAGGVTLPRNPTLMKIFMLTGLVDRAGSGLQAIYRTWLERFGKRPELEETYAPDEVRITLPLAPSGKGPNPHRRITADEIIALCRERGEVRADDLVEAFGMQRSAAQVALRRLVKAGKLYVEHYGRDAVYRVAPTLF